MIDCTHISTPMDPIRWLEAVDNHWSTLTAPDKQAAFADHRFRLWPFLLARDGRLHPTWSATAWTGRISAAGPALQQIPKPLRAGIRSPGHLIIAADWRGSHLRLLAHHSGDEVLTADLRGDVYQAPADILIGLGVPPESARKAAKRALLTKLNGGGTELLRQVLLDHGAPNDIDVGRFIAPLIRRWETAFRHLAWVSLAAERASWKIATPFSEPVEVPEDKRNTHHVVAGWLQALEVEALRHVVRYAKKHQTKKNSVVRLIAVVHDETVWEVRPENADKAMNRVTKLMNAALFPKGSALASNATEVTIGPSWGEQDGTRVPPNGTTRAPAAWARHGVAAIMAVAEATRPKAALHDMLANLETRFALEMARLHAAGDLRPVPSAPRGGSASSDSGQSLHVGVYPRPSGSHKRRL